MLFTKYATLRAESLSIFLDKLGKGKKTLQAALTFFDLPLIQRNDLSNLFLKFLHIINRHDSSISFKIYNHVAIFSCLNSHEYFHCMSVTELRSL